MAILVGSVEVDVVPNAANFAATLRAVLEPQAGLLGATLGRRIADGINTGIRERLRDPFNNLPGNPGRAGLGAGNRYGGAFHDAVQTRVRSALANLPTPELRINVTPAERQMALLRNSLTRLSDKRIGIDISAEDAKAEIATLSAAFRALGAQSVDIQVKADLLQAAAQLEVIDAELSRLDGRSVDIDVDVHGDRSISTMGKLVLAGAAIGPAIVPAAAAATAAIGAMGPMALSAAAGVGVLVLAFNGIGQAVTDSAEASKNATKEAATIAASQAAAATAANGARSAAKAATASLANVIATADSAAIRSAQGVAAARKGVASAISQGVAAAAAAASNLANTIAKADAAAVRSARAVVDARKGVVTATKAAAAANVAAAATAVTAERAVQQAVKDSARAVLDLVDARKTAQRQLDDFADRTADGLLSERQGVLDVADALAGLASAKSDPGATLETMAQAQLAYDRSVQQLAETRKANGRLAEDKAEADKKGVEGSDLVKTAQERVLDAVNAEAAAREKSATAEAAITSTRLAGIAKVVTAEGKIGIALAAQVEQARTSAVAITKAKKAVTDGAIASAAKVVTAEKGIATALAAQADQARLSKFAISQAKDAVIESGQALDIANRKVADSLLEVGPSAQKAADSLKGLSPAGQEFVGFINEKMRPAIKNLRTQAQEGLLPGVQTALESLLPFLPSLGKFIGQVATEMGNLFVEGAKALKAPFWREFFGDLSKSIIPSIKDTARVIGNLITGFAGMVSAFIPVNAKIGGGLVSLTGKFATWAKGLKDNDGFQKFVAYAMENGPRLLAAIGEIIKALVHIGVAAAPIGVVVVAAFEGLAKVINAIPTPVLTGLLVLIGGFAVTLAVVNIALGIWAGMLAIASAATAVWGAVMWVAGAAMAFLTWPIVLIIAGIVALIVVIVLIVKNWDTLKAAGAAAWEWIKEKAIWAKDKIVEGWNIFIEWCTALPGKIGAKLSGMWDSFTTWLGDALTKARAKWDGFIEWLKEIPGKIGAKISGAWDSFVTKLATKIAEGRAKWDAFIEWLKEIPGKVGKKISGAWDSFVTGLGTKIAEGRAKWDTFIEWIKGIPGKIGSGLKDLWNSLPDGFKAKINEMIDMWNRFELKVGGAKVGGVTFPSVSFKTPDMKHFATGGVVTAPTIGLFGEAGPEAVVPLSDSKVLADMLGQIRPADVGGAGGRNVTVQQTINNPLPERATVSGPAGLRRAALVLGV